MVQHSVDHFEEVDEQLDRYAIIEEKLDPYERVHYQRLSSNQLLVHLCIYQLKIEQTDRKSS
jgi:hypothetical protein